MLGQASKGAYGLDVFEDIWNILGHEFSTIQGCLKVCNALKSWGVGSMPVSGNESVPGSLRWEQASHACPHETVALRPSASSPQGPRVPFDSNC